MHNGTARRITLTIDESLCRACRKCLGARVCKTGAIRNIDPGEPPYLDPSLCRGCLICTSACPAGAIVRIEALAAADNGSNGNGSNGSHPDA